jgi:ABC-type nitrate/sulfonate/bicarbonate transport system ATPase subunit
VLITHNISDAVAIATRSVVIGKRPVSVLSDLAFRPGVAGEIGAADYDAMQAALISGIRDGLV